MNQKASFETLSYRVADNGVAYVTIDVPGHRVNVLTPELHAEIGLVADRLAGDDDAVGAVIHSGKSSFLAGGDLKRIVRYFDMGRSPEQAYRESRSYTEALRRLETCGKPVAVAINGTALGGGLELALACHFRVVLDDPDCALGLPEVTLGLIPGGGGTQRLPRLIGIEKAASLILSGNRLTPAQALELGVVDELAPAEDLLTAAERWILEEGQAEQPWDRKGYRVPGGAGLRDLAIASLFSRLTAKVGAEYRHNYPAPVAALRCLFNGTVVGSMDEALRVETREFSALTRDPVARNIIRTLFIEKGKAERRAREDRELRPRREAIAGKLRDACLHEARVMLDEGIGAPLIGNVAYAAGLPEDALELESRESSKPEAGRSPDPVRVRQRLLCRPALVAAEQWVAGEWDPVEADLASVIEWDFPAYTGGVMSLIDTMGLAAFVELCDRLADEAGDRFRPSDALRDRSGEADRVYLAQN